MKENKLYVAYGNNLNLDQMKDRCPYATALGTATLEGFQLLFRGGEKSGYATVEPADGETVPVLLWEITPRCEEALDRYDGYPRLYGKSTIKIGFNGETVEAMIYIMNERPNLGLPCERYLATIMEGYKTAGFEPTVLEKAMVLSSLGGQYAKRY